MPVTRAPFGVTGDGQAVEVWTLTRGALEAEILTFGAAVRALRVPDRDGKALDVVLGYDTLAEYEHNGGYLGALVGRYANRIAKARCLIDGAVVPLEASEGENQLHGGVRGFSYRVFQAEAAGDSALRLTYTAADGEGGFPGALTLTATYTLTDRGLRLRYEAVSDKATYCNITNHSYFNLNGHASGTVLGHRLSMDAPEFLETDADLIPTGRILPVAGTALDFTEEKTLGRDIGADETPLKYGGGYDHCLVVPDSGLRHIAWLTGPQTGIRMETLSTLPGVQLYTSNMLEVTTPCKDGAQYEKRCAVCLETQDYPDAPNHMEFPDTTVTPKAAYSATTIYRFDIAPE